MSFFRAVLAGLIISAVGLGGCYLVQDERLGKGAKEKKQPPELPAEFRENLSRVTPKGTRIQSYRRTRTESGFQFEVEAETPSGPIRILMDQKGLPLKMREVPETKNIPRSITKGLDEHQIRNQIQRQWLLLYEIETEQEDGQELETFVDGWGTLRFSLVETEEGDEEKISWEALPQKAKANLGRFLKDAPPVSIYRETEWNRVFFEITWRGEYGMEELKCFEDGQVLLWEMPPDFPISKNIRSHLKDDPPEALFMALYCRSNDESEICVLADGTPFPEGLDDRNAP